MEIQKGNGRFYISSDEGGEEAEIVFVSQSKDVISIERTFVPEAMRGRNIAGQLLQKVVEMARAEGLKIYPECPYAQKVLTRGDEYKDVLWTNDLPLRPACPTKDTGKAEGL